MESNITIFFANVKSLIEYLLIFIKAKHIFIHIVEFIYPNKTQLSRAFGNTL